MNETNKMTVQISKDKTEFIMNGFVIDRAIHNDWRDFTLNQLYDYCCLFIRAFYDKEDAVMSEALFKLLQETNISYDPDDEFSGQRFMIELSKLAYSMEI